MSDLDILCPLRDGRRNADDMGMPPAMTTPTPKCTHDPLLKLVADVVTLPKGFNCVACAWIARERDLAAAREALDGQRDELDSLQGTHCGGDCLAAPCSHCDGTQHVPGKIDRLKEELEEAQEARQAAEERAERMEGLLLLSLYHHQGGSSPVGQPIRRLLGIGPHDHMTDEQIERGKAAGRDAIDAAIAGGEEAVRKSAGYCPRFAHGRGKSLMYW